MNLLKDCAVFVFISMAMVLFGACTVQAYTYGYGTIYFFGFTFILGMVTMVRVMDLVKFERAIKKHAAIISVSKEQLEEIRKFEDQLVEQMKKEEEKKDADKD